MAKKLSAQQAADLSAALSGQAPSSKKKAKPKEKPKGKKEPGQYVKAPKRKKNVLDIELKGEGGKANQSRTPLQREQHKATQRSQKARVTSTSDPVRPRIIPVGKYVPKPKKEKVAPQGKVVIKLKKGERLLPKAEVKIKPINLKKNKSTFGKALGYGKSATRLATLPARKTLDTTLKASDTAFDALEKVGEIQASRNRAVQRYTNPKGKKTPFANQAAASPATVGPTAKVGKVSSRVVLNTAKTVADDPGKQVPKAISDTAKSVTAIPAGIAKSVTDPKGAAKGIAADYKRRYGVLASDDPKANEKFRKRQAEEGVAPELFDIATVATAGGATAGRVGTSLAKAGKLGKKAEKFAKSNPKPLRISGGKVQERVRDKNIIKAVAKEVVDEKLPRYSRSKVQARRASKENVPIVIREAQSRGELTRISKSRTARLARKQTFAGPKGQSVIRNRVIQQREVTRGTEKSYAELSKLERKAFKQAMDLGIRTPAQARKEIPKRIAAIKGIRQERADAGTPVKIRKADQVPELEELLVNADKAFTPKVAAAAEREGVRGQRLAMADPQFKDQLHAQRVRYEKQGEHLGVLRREKETDRDYVKRVKATAKKQGLDRPGYFPSKELVEGEFGARTTGGTKAMMADRQRTGELFRTGRESSDRRLLPTAHARNIKRGINHKLVSDTLDGAQYGRYNKADGKGKTLHEQKLDVDNDGVTKVAYWNPGIYNKIRRAQGDTDVDVESELGDVSIEDALKHSTWDGKSTVPDEYANDRGWKVVDESVYDEIHDAVKSGKSDFVGRSWDIGKGKMSRVILAHPAWLSFQTASNGLLTGISGTGPKSIVDSQRFWRKLTPEQKDAIEPYIGVKPFHDDQTRLGAASNSKVINSYRAFKQTDFYKKAHKANPLDLIFRVDNAQNNFWRKAVFYNKAKKEAYARMGKNASVIQKGQQRLEHMFDLDPEDQIKALAKNRKDIERVAESVNEFLGDYTTYTAKERRVLSRAVMFYGFLRFSLKFSMYTMPAKHPIMSSIFLQLGRLQTDEIDRIFGGEAAPWEYGKFYTKSGRAYDLARLNPWVNANQYFDLSEGKLKPQAVAGVLPPFAQAGINQIAGKNVAFDKPYTTKGSASYKVHGKDLDAEDRALIFLNEAFLKPAAAYRTAAKTGIPGVTDHLRGKQGDDSSLLSKRPIKYKDAVKIAENNQAIKEETGKTFGQLLQENLAPLAGKEGKGDIRKGRAYIRENKKGSGKKLTQKQIIDLQIKAADRIRKTSPKEQQRIIDLQLAAFERANR